MDWKRELQEQLAEATKLVWKMQNALSEGPGLTDEIIKYAHLLHGVSGIIEGHISRWDLFEHSVSFARSREELVEYCRLYAEHIYVRAEVEGRRLSVPLDSLPPAEITAWIDKWWAERRIP
jgi:hypothetical protein